MTMLDEKCDVCGVNPSIGVASTSMPYSCAYCKECAERGADPIIVFVCFYDDFGTNFDLMRDPDGLVTYMDGQYVSYRDWALKQEKDLAAK